jgi:ubiquitin C-terminal hydrolase
LSGIGGLSRGETETSIIHQIFGGYLKSVVKCAACGYESPKIDPFLDLSLEIKGCNTLTSALKVFSAPEILGKGDQYRCEK